MKTKREYKKHTFLGRHYNENIYLTAPSWDCGWYWGFGYLGNNNCHYHVDGLMKDKNLYDGLKEHFGNSLIIRESHLWKFAELFKSFYTLKETAEVLERGGCHYTTNPCKDIITNKHEAERINKDVLPAIFDEIYNILEANSNNSIIFDELVDINVNGDTMKVVDYMKQNDIKPDDLKNISQLTNNDYYNIHSYYWDDYHKNNENRNR